MAVYVAVDVICLFLGMIIGGSKGFTGLGIILGLLLGPLGVLIVAVMKPTPEVQAKRQLEVEAAVEAERARQVEAERRRLQGQQPDSRA